MVERAVFEHDGISIAASAISSASDGYLLAPALLDRAPRPTAILAERRAARG
jgi:hypothetical protein